MPKVLRDLLVGDANLDGDVDVWAMGGSGDVQSLNPNLGAVLDIGAAPAVDEAIKQAVTDQNTAATLSAVLDWQYEFESVQSKCAKRKDVEATVDLLLSTEWA